MTVTFIALGFIMSVVTVYTCTASPLLPSESRKITGLQVQRGAQDHDARMERFAPLPEDQRRFTSKQILQALSEIIQRDDCISDYQGWVDFGRRSTD
ncbi:hypothetical protein Baya_8501 [Bagarius yarrelli]|uniref:Gastrin/cholecystokinin peptide hormone domain-containing protein n=1 Tax=Bagarius yarrelli TaxID=175774 RepID=A0A556U5U5_BAGYA|nr:hypothetical protein Baya_8501 [Bagarius yarrelli]